MELIKHTMLAYVQYPLIVGGGACDSNSKTYNFIIQNIFLKTNNCVYRVDMSGFITSNVRSLGNDHRARHRKRAVGERTVSLMRVQLAPP